MTATPVPIIAARYGATASPEALDLPSSYNVAPTDPLRLIVTVRNGDDRRVVPATWGIVPPWAGSATSGTARHGPQLLFNIRSETAPSRQRDALTRRRCAVVVDGFYEWSGPKEKVAGRSTRTPWYVRRRDGDVLALAGLWASTPGGVQAAVLTTGPDRVMAALHDRMPVCLDDDELAVWLDPAVGVERDVSVLEALMSSPIDAGLEAYKVSPVVNGSRAEGPQLCEPIDTATSSDTATSGSQRTLF